MGLDGPSDKHIRTLSTEEEALPTGNEIRQLHHSLENSNPQYNGTPTAIKHIQLCSQKCKSINL
jgi:hypothetical protein